MRLLHLLEVLKSLEHPILEDCLMHSVIESPDRDLATLHLMPSLLLDFDAPTNTHCVHSRNTPPPKIKAGSARTIALLLRHGSVAGSRNKIMDETEKRVQGFLSSGKSLLLRLSAHWRNRLVVEEMDRKKVKELVSLLDNLWKSISMGATTVPQGTMQLIKEFLGEGGSHCFDEIFAPLQIAGAPNYLVAQHFWYCWTEFLAHSLSEDFVKEEVSAEDSSMQDESTHSSHMEGGLYGDLSQHNIKSAGKSIEGPQGTQVLKIEISIKDRIKAYFSKSNRISEQFCKIRLSSMEREWTKVAGSLSEPLTVHTINQFLTFVLVDYPHTITTYNCKEFCNYFDKKLEAQGTLYIYICICMCVRLCVCVCVCVSVSIYTCTCMYLHFCKKGYWLMYMDTYRCCLPRRVLCHIH